MLEGLIVQGDVVLDPVSMVPEGELVEPKERGYVLAEGEVTGHAHVIEEIKSVTMVKTKDGHVYLTVKEQVPLKHEEHHIVIIEPGQYEVRKQLEFDHFSRVTREVLD